MIRTTIIGMVLKVYTPVTIGEGDKAIKKQTIVIKQNAEEDPWSGRSFPSDFWAVDIIGDEEIKRLAIDQTYEPQNEAEGLGTYGEFFLQINSRPVDKKQTPEQIKKGDKAEVIFPVNVRLGKVDWSKYK